MFEELKHPNTKLTSMNVYVNDKHVDQSYTMTYDFIESIEFSACFTSPCVNAQLMCKKLFIDGVSYGINDIKNNTIRLILTDSNNNTFDKRFKVLDVKNVTNSRVNDSTQCVLILMDLYGFVLFDQSATTSITKRQYKGSPFEIIKETFKDLFKLTDEIVKSYNEIPLEIVYQDNDIDFCDKVSEIEWNYSSSMSPIENLRVICEIYNIRIYQDLNKMYVIRNVKLSLLPKISASDGLPLFRENVGTIEYPYKITDKIRKPRSNNYFERPNFEITTFEDCKKPIRKVLLFEQFIDLILLNSNREEYSTVTQEKPIRTSSQTQTTDTIIYNNFLKFYNMNNLTIFTRPTFEACNNGTIVDTFILPNSEFTKEQIDGDDDMCGNWLVNSVTYKILSDLMVCRMCLCRYDNPRHDHDEPYMFNEEILINTNSYVSSGEYVDVMEVIYNLQNGINTRIGYINNNATSLKEALKGFSLGSITSNLKETWSNIKNTVKDIETDFKYIKKDFSMLSKEIKNNFKDIKNDLKTLDFKEFKEDLKDVFDLSKIPTEIMEESIYYNAVLNDIESEINVIESEINGFKNLQADKTKKHNPNINIDYEIEDRESRLAYLKTIREQKLKDLRIKQGL